MQKAQQNDFVQSNSLQQIIIYTSHTAPNTYKDKFCNYNHYTSHYSTSQNSLSHLSLSNAYQFWKWSIPNSKISHSTNDNAVKSSLYQKYKKTCINFGFIFAMILLIDNFKLSDAELPIVFSLCKAPHCANCQPHQCICN